MTDTQEQNGIIGHGFLSGLVAGPGDIAAWLNQLHDDYSKVELRYIFPTAGQYVVLAEVWE